MDENEKTYKEAREKITKILDECGIELEIWGCGCCSSPEVTFIYKGETFIIKKEFFLFSNIKDIQHKAFWEQVMEGNI